MKIGCQNKLPRRKNLKISVKRLMFQCHFNINRDREWSERRSRAVSTEGPG